MIIKNTSQKLSALGLPKKWQAFIVLHALFSLSIIFMTNDLLLNISNIVATSLIFFGVVSAYKYHKHNFLDWGSYVTGIGLISLSVIIYSLTSFGFYTNPLLATLIEEAGLILISLFTFSLMIRFEKTYKLDGFTINYGLIVISITLFLIIISPNIIKYYLYMLSFAQKLNIISLLVACIALSMAVVNHILCKKLLIKDIIRIIIFLLLGIHFAMEVVDGANPQISRISWAIYHFTGSLSIAFIFLENLTTNCHDHTVRRINNNFTWSASILAIIAIPFGIIIRDRMGFPPISAIVVGTASFIFSSIVIWRLQKLIYSINTQRKKLKKIAYTDPLTNLYNYHGYLEKLSYEGSEELLVVNLNIEDFKSINDLYGRNFGDDVLVSLAARLKKTPGIILAARTGADYFQAVFKIPEEEVPSLIKKIQEHLGIWDIVNKQRIAVPLTYGASYKKKNSLIKAEDLTRQAEHALTESRHQHTDFTLYKADEKISNNKTLPRHELREILQKAVDDNYLPIHFQPIYDLHDGSLKALEMLIRVESKEHGLLLPWQFLDLAKSYGLLTSLTQVCIHMIAKYYEKLPDVTININVAPYMLDNQVILDNFIHCFIEEKLSMKKFCIEVTEDGDIPTNHLIPAITQLKKEGFKIAMDDFGTGYSSLSRLSVLPVDVVKIDRSLLLAASAGNENLLESAITLSKRLGASVVVEGVETIEQLKLIKKLGADSVQGYLFSKPVNIKKASKLPLNAINIIPEF